MKIGEFLLEENVVMGGAADVTGAAGAGADIVDRIMHRLDDIGMLAHAEIVVAAPDDDVFDAVLGVPAGLRKRAVSSG